MKRSGWVVAVLLVVLAAVLLFNVNATNRRQKAARLASYRYQMDARTETYTAGVTYVEKDTIAPHVLMPHAIVVDGENHIVVGGESNLTILAADGTLLKNIHLELPVWCLAVDSEGTIYAGNEQSVSVIEREGTIRDQWTSLGENARLTSLAVQGGNVFVADAGQRVVWRLDLQGRLLGRITGEGFIVPSPYFDVLADEDGLWVANPGRLRVEHYTKEGQFLSAWGEQGMDMNSFCGCCNPIHLLRMPSGEVLTAEKGLARIKILNASGEVVSVVADQHAFAAPEGTFTDFTLIADVAVDSTGRIFALMSASGRIRVFAPEEKKP